MHKQLIFNSIQTLLYAQRKHRGPSKLNGYMKAKELYFWVAKKNCKKTLKDQPDFSNQST